MYGITRLALPVLGVTGLVFATLGPLGSSAAVASQPTCRFTLNSVKALDLNDNDGQDETTVKLGDTNTGEKTYTDNQIRRQFANDDFQGTERVRITERDAANVTLLGSANIPCANASASTDVSGPGGAIYRLKWNVLVVP
jgi:hypothetical protein